MSVTKSEWFRKAGDGSMIFSRSWTGQNPKAILILAHGMAEHSARYDEFASFLAEGGVSVYMNDHRGHGRTAREADGYFGEKDGWEKVLGDLRDLEQEAWQKEPGLPVFLMGHSMGSFLARSYPTRWGQSLSGCILSGTMGENPALGAAKAIASLQCKIRGPKSVGKLLSKLSSGGYLDGIETPVNDFAWLSRDDEVCKIYAKDPLCGFPFTAAGYRDMFGGIVEISSLDWAKKVPKSLPVLVYAGDKDPVGAIGKGPAQVAGWLEQAGVENVSLKLYPGMRHECHNELGKEEVYGDVLGWIQANLPGEGA